MSYTHVEMYGMSLSNPYLKFLKVIRKQHFKGNQQKIFYVHVHVCYLHYKKEWNIQICIIKDTIKVCQDIADSLDNGDRVDAIVIDFSKAFDLVPHDRLLVKIAASGVDFRVVVWIREFILGRTQRVRVGGQFSE
jgi:hypothetical protein